MLMRLLFSPLALLLVFWRAIGGGTPLEPPREFAHRLDVGRCVGECPQCRNELMDCDCQWSAQG